MRYTQNIGRPAPLNPDKEASTHRRLEDGEATFLVVQRQYGYRERIHSEAESEKKKTTTT